MNCPICAAVMEFDGDGYWCPKCEEYYPPDIIAQYMEDEG